MVTCYLTYQIDRLKIKEFEHYAKSWIKLVEKLGGKHLGYYLPHEGPSDLAVALFNFPSMADYELYRKKSLEDPECIEANEYGAITRCFIRYDRHFMRPLTSENYST